MWWDNVDSVAPGICFASFAIRSCFVEMSSGLELPAIFPSCGSVTRRPLYGFHFPPPSPFGCGSPASSVLLGRSDSSLSVPRPRRLGGRYLRPGYFHSVRKAAPRGRWLPAGLVRVTAGPTRSSCHPEETERSPRFLGSPRARACVLRPRWDPLARPLWPWDVAFRHHNSVGSHN